MSNESVILGEWTMRRGDRLPMLSVVVENDATPPQPVDLTGATAWLQLRCEDGFDPLTLPETFPSHEIVNGWVIFQVYVYDQPGGVVVYDWPDYQTAGLTVGIDEFVIRCDFPDGSRITAPSDRSARLVVRPAVLPPALGGTTPPPVIPPNNCVSVLNEPFNDYTTNGWTLGNLGGGNPTIVSGRTGTAAQCTLGSTATWTIPSGNRSDTVTIGFAFRTSAAGGSGIASLIEFRSDAGATVHNRLAINTSTWALQLERVGSAVLGSGGVVSSNTWYYVEVQVTLGDSGAAYAVRLNGTTVISGSGDTRNGGTNTVYEDIKLTEPAGFTSSNNQFDDLYLSTGSDCAFKGDITIP